MSFKMFLAKSFIKTFESQRYNSLKEKNIHQKFEFRHLAMANPPNSDFAILTMVNPLNLYSIDYYWIHINISILAYVNENKKSKFTHI